MPSARRNPMPERWTVSVTVVIAVTALLGLAMPAAAGVPSATQSFYVPQSGDPDPAGLPDGAIRPLSPAVFSEGDAATQWFRMCPNNHGGTSLPFNARIKVVVRDNDGNPMPGIAASDICILFNGGTPGYGFSGIGADSVVANSQWNTMERCPDVRCVSADGPTNAGGVTFITFAGASPSNPGVTLRDPNRKWGHWDSELPVYVLGFRISGRLTSAPGETRPYVLRIKNIDVSGGISIPTQANTGELVDAADVATVHARNTANPPNPNHLFYYWSNLNGLCNGTDGDCVTQEDTNIVLAHFSPVSGTRHDCNYPLP
jgi:hypothetical protein